MLFGLDFVRLAMIVEFNYRMSIEKNSSTKRDVEYRVLRLDFSRLIATQIIELATNSPWVDGNGEIRKVSLHFAGKFL